MNRTVSLVDVASYLPEKEVDVQWYLDQADTGDPLRDNVMFKAPQRRRHIAPDESAVDLAERAARTLLDRQGSDAAGGVDILLTQTILPEIPFTGIGAEVAHRLGAAPEWIIDHHNGACASFVGMLKLARSLILSSEAKTALIVNVANAAGTIFTQDGVRNLTHAAVPGDAAGAALVTASAGSPVLGIRTLNSPAYAQDAGVRNDQRRKYWEVRSTPVDISFSSRKVANIVNRGNRLVPELVTDLFTSLGRKTDEIDTLVTNQPNRMFLRNWREALDVPPERHLDTYDSLGNIFGAGMPVTLDHGIRAGSVQDDSLVVLAGFANAGDYAGAAAIHWKAASASGSGSA